MFKKITAIMLAVLTALTLLVSCDNSPVQEGLVPSRRSLTINGKEEKFPFVMEVNGNKVSLDEYILCFTQIRSSMDYGDTSVWANENNAQMLHERVEIFVLQKYALLSIAEEYGITLTEEEIEVAVSQLEEVKEQFETEEAFVAAMQEFGATENTFIELYNMFALYDKVYETLYGIDGVLAEPFEVVLERATTEYVHVKHILISFGENPEEAFALALEIQERAEAGEDFDELRAQYDTDAAGQPPEGYFFTYQMMVLPFEEASFALASGEISGPVETNYGYHIILKLEITEEDVYTNYELFTVNTTMALDMLIADEIEMLDVKYASNYDLLTVQNVLAALRQ